MAVIKELAKGVYVGTMLGYGRDCIDTYIGRYNNPVSRAAITQVRYEMEKQNADVK
jgi:hypothetical protein